MQLSCTPPIGLRSNDITLRMADRGTCDVTSARVRMTVSRDTNRSISGRLAAPLVATLSYGRNHIWYRGTSGQFP